MPLDPERFPKKLFGKYHDEKKKKQPNLFMGNGFWIVSEACAEVLRNFDLGQTKLYPVELFQYDRKTPVEGSYHVIAFGEQKRTYAPEHCERVRGGRYNKKDLTLPHTLPAAVQDNEMALFENALEGPDLWIDPDLMNGLFLSQELGLAIKAAKMTRDWKPRKCRIVAR